MSKWIKCSEQMPLCDTYVLIFTPSEEILIGRLLRMVYVYGRKVPEIDIWWEIDERGVGYTNVNTYKVEEIKYWRPLPEPPEES